MRILVKWLLMTVAIMITAYLLPGVSVQSLWAALVTALVLGLVNAVLRPILIVLTLPLTVLTLGLFILILNGFLVLLTSAMVSGFHVLNFWWAFLFSLVFSVVSFVLQQIFA
ncbi:phage holin family protein [archaeon]|nr:phage holin family protein [archaeon]